MQQKIRISILFILFILQLLSCDKKRYGDVIFWQKQEVDLVLPMLL